MVKKNQTIAVASGKGGTGKTTIATNLAAVLSSFKRTDTGVQLIDCDVEEPNAHLFLSPQYSKREEVTISIPQIDKTRCTQCGRCSDFCVYNALAMIGQEILIFPELCHGCGGCKFICPAHGITEVQRVIGWVDLGVITSVNGDFDFVRGELKISSPMAPPIIRHLKELIRDDWLTIIDAPPGTSCSVVSTLYGTDYVILVTEPSPFGLHDLKLAYAVVKKLQIPCGVVINRADFSQGDRSIEKFCIKEGITVLQKIPFAREYARCYAQGDLLIQQFSELRSQFLQLFERIGEEMK